MHFACLPLPLRNISSICAASLSRRVVMSSVALCLLFLEYTYINVPFPVFTVRPPVYVSLVTPVTPPNRRHTRSKPTGSLGHGGCVGVCGRSGVGPFSVTEVYAIETLDDTVFLQSFAPITLCSSESGHIPVVISRFIDMLDRLYSTIV